MSARDPARAAKRLTDFGHQWDKANGFAVVPAVVKAPVKKRVIKKGLTTSIRQAAASILRRQAVVVPMRCVPATGGFDRWLLRRAA